MKVHVSNLRTCKVNIWARNSFGISTRWSCIVCCWDLVLLEFDLADIITWKVLARVSYKFVVWLVNLYTARDYVNEKLHMLMKECSLLLTRTVIGNKINNGKNRSNLQFRFVPFTGEIQFRQKYGWCFVF